MLALTKRSDLNKQQRQNEESLRQSLKYTSDDKHGSVGFDSNGLIAAGVSENMSPTPKKFADDYVRQESFDPERFKYVNSLQKIREESQTEFRLGLTGEKLREIVEVDDEASKRNSNDPVRLPAYLEPPVLEPNAGHLSDKPPSSSNMSSNDRRPSSTNSQLVTAMNHNANVARAHPFGVKIRDPS